MSHARRSARATGVCSASLQKLRGGDVALVPRACGAPERPLDSRGPQIRIEHVSAQRLVVGAGYDARGCGRVRGDKLLANDRLARFGSSRLRSRGRADADNAPKPQRGGRHAISSAQDTPRQRRAGKATVNRDSGVPLGVQLLSLQCVRELETVSARLLLGLAALAFDAGEVADAAIARYLARLRDASVVAGSVMEREMDAAGFDDRAGARRSVSRNWVSSRKRLVLGVGASMEQA